MSNVRIPLQPTNKPFSFDALAADIERLMRCIDAAMGCLDPDSKNKDERLAWYRLYDAEMGREPRANLD